MVQMLEESKEAGLKTLVLLDEQGEQLDRIEGAADTINKEMKEAEKNLEGLEQCCGLCVLPWQKTKSFEKGEDYNKTWKKSEDGKLNANGPRRIIGDTGPQGKGFVNRITNDAREDEMDENLVQVSSMIGNLRNMAIDMGNEIETQNQLIGRVQAKVIFLFAAFCSIKLLTMNHTCFRPNRIRPVSKEQTNAPTSCLKLNNNLIIIIIIQHRCFSFSSSKFDRPTATIYHTIFFCT